MGGGGGHDGVEGLDDAMESAVRSDRIVCTTLNMKRKPSKERLFFKKKN